MTHLLFPPLFLRRLALFGLLILTFNACNKSDRLAMKPEHSAEVIDKWMTLQLRLMRNATGIPNQAFARHFAYSGVAALASLRPELKGNEKWLSRLNGLAGLPEAKGGKNNYLPENANAALAAINRAFFTGASAIDKAAIDSLEAALKNSFSAKASPAVIAQSETFGKETAAAVFAWAETDGYKVANAAYTVPVGVGLWKPTPPAFAPPSTPYWGNIRTVFEGSTQNLGLPAPPAYSTNPASAFYQMVKGVYDASLTLTDDQKAMAIFWRDVPGATTPGHWLSIVQQAVRNEGALLEKAAVAYALVGGAVNDALIACFAAKYLYNVQRPVTYIREVMGQTSWSSFIGTPPHPEYPSNHAALSAAAAVVMERLFGQRSFTDHTYDYLGLPARSFASFKALGEEAGQSRLYGGIHYQYSVDVSLPFGRQLAQNILSPDRAD